MPGSEFTDALGRTIAIAVPPARIVCLCPSLTETLFSIGAGDRVVGRTNFCIHPADRVAVVPTVGGTKDVDPGAVRELRPDLIIAEKEENRRETVADLAEIAPVYVFDVVDLPGAQDAIRILGRLTATAAAANALADEITHRFRRMPPAPPLTVLHLVWQQPLMAAGSHTYINAILATLGLHNAAADLPGRYPRLEPGQLRALVPDVLLLSSEPFPFTDEHVRAYAADLPDTYVRRVDGEAFGWYGSRMLAAADTLGTLVTDLRDAFPHA
jgi:iron complex transport system substrate-binding protein